MDTLEIIGIVFEIIPIIVTAASAVAAVTPTPKDDLVISKVYKWLIDIPALNFGRAKEK